MGQPAAASDAPLDNVSISTVEAFEEAWETGRPDVAEFLRRHPGRPLRLLLELAAIDLERRLRRRDAATAQEYRSRFPELGHCPDCSAELDRVARIFQHGAGEVAPAPTFPDGRRDFAGSPQDDISTTHSGDVRSLWGRLVGSGDVPDARSRLGMAGESEIFLGPYRLLAELGTGGMGTVYRAEHRTMRREVALKVIKSAGLESPEAVRRFEREVHAVARLQHPNIVTAFDAGEASGTHYLVMELIDGRSLAEVIRDDGPQPPPRAIEWVLQAARGLAYAHGRGVVHRDIKPGNLLIDRDGTVRILDMGLARVESPHAAPDQLTETGQVMGTVDFMAPEQALDTRLADARADIYSLGVTLWYLLTGRPLFEAESAVQKLLAHQQKPAPSLAEAGAAVDPRLEATFQRMVAKKPEERFQTVREVIAALEPLTTEPSAPAPSVVSPGLKDAPSGSPTARNPRPRSEAGQKEDRDGGGVGNHDGREEDVTSSDWAGRSARVPKPRYAAIGGWAVGAVLLVAAALFASSGRRDPGPDGRSRESRGGPAPRPMSQPKAVASPPVAQASSSAIPPRAVAPFDAAQARRYQEAWADHLGDPVETTNSIGQTLVLIPPSYFTMGAGNDTMQVTLTKPYRLTATEVSQGQWKQMMGKEPWKCNEHPDGRRYWAEGDLVAATTLTWKEAVAFCERLTSRERALGVIRHDQEYRLPTEAEWENACRAGTTTLFSFGDSPELLGDHGWFGGGWDTARSRPIAGGNTLDAAHPHKVAMKAPNNWGLYDMHGNVEEWCHDLLPRGFPRSTSNPLGVPREPHRAARGGTWYSGGYPAHVRLPYPIDKTMMGTGFRVALVTADPEGTSFERVADETAAETQAPDTFPADAATARRHQEDAAKALGIPVEATNSLGQTLVLIPPGRFTMGEGGRAVVVTLTKPFLLGQTEVTRGQWRMVMKTEPWAADPPPGGDHVAATVVKWTDAVVFCERLTASERQSGVIGPTEEYRLPGEAEWEYACRAGTVTAYSFGDAEGRLGEYAWYGGDWDAGTRRFIPGGNTADAMHAHEVGLKRPNPWGLHDMHGNVGEWCRDWLADIADTASDPMPPSTETGPHCIRGGAWGLPPRMARSATRTAKPVSHVSAAVGFRVCRTIAEAAKIDVAPRGVPASVSPAGTREEAR